MTQVLIDSSKPNELYLLELMHFLKQGYMYTMREFYNEPQRSFHNMKHVDGW